MVTRFSDQSRPADPPAAGPDDPWLPRQPVTFELVTRLALACREPCRSQAMLLQAGQPLRLHREADNPHDSQAIRVDNLQGWPVGYLQADIASWLAILLDHAPDIVDESCVETILTAAPPGDPDARRLRYPRLFVRLRLHLASAWPMFAIAAILGLKTDHFAERFNLAGNPWLRPLQSLHSQYLRLGHDQFSLPDSLVAAWRRLTA